MLSPKEEKQINWEDFDQRKYPAPSSEWSCRVHFLLRNWAVDQTTVCRRPPRLCAWDVSRFELRYLLAYGIRLIRHGSADVKVGTHVFEGVKACRHPDGSIAIWRPEAHASRFRESAAFVAMEEVPEDVFIQAIELAIQRNAEFVPPHDSTGLLYIRPLLFGSSEQVGLEPPNEVTYCVFVQPHFSLYGGNTKAYSAVILDQFDRVATRGSGKAKMGGNYACGPKWTRIARRDFGCQLVLHLDSRTQTEIEEFSASGFIGIRADTDGVMTLVYSDSDAVLDSITVDSAAAIAKAMGWRVERRPIKYTELATFSEVVTAGTAAGILPVGRIVRSSNGEAFTFDACGPGYLKISGLLKGIQTGVEQDKFSWCRVVPKK